jgi:hypothetical protein
MRMRVISLWEPWASLMAANVKRNETRSWATPYRGWLAIASTASMNTTCKQLLATPPFSDEVRKALGRESMPTPQFIASFQLGRILCIVKLERVLSTDQIQAVPYPESLFGDYTPGRFAWMTRDCRKLPEPIPHRGSQGLSLVDPDIEAAIWAQVS